MKRSMYSTSLRLSLALILAMVLWVFVSFTENPQQSIPLTNMPVFAEGLDVSLTMVDAQGLPLAAPDAEINAAMVGPRNLLGDLTKQNAQPYVNLAGLGPGIHKVPVNLRLIPVRSEVSFQAITPDAIMIEIEQIVSTTVPLSVTTIGQPPTSYEASVPIALVNGQSISTVTLSGPASQVQRVVAGQITVDLASQTANLRTSRSITPIDALGHEVEGVRIIPDEATVSISILSSSGIKRVPTVPVVQDLPPPGYRVTVVLDPAFVSVIGSSRTLSNVTYIETVPMTLEGTLSFTRTVRLVFPSGITPRDATAGETVVATVNVELLPATFQLQLPVGMRNLAAATLASISPDLLTVRLQGDTTLLQSISLNLTVDLEGRPPGTYTLLPALSLPPGLILAEPLPAVQVTILDNTPPPTLTLPALTPTTVITPGLSPTPGASPEPPTPEPPTPEPPAATPTP